MPAQPFAEGETVLLLDKGGNRRLVTLRVGGKAHGHKGYLEHDRMIGACEGVVVRSSSGSTYAVFRPRLSEYVLEMPRRSAIVYPKDVGFILGWADIYPGATVVESGLGSGSLTLALLRAVGPTGQVIVYEQRADMIESAMLNLGKFADPGIMARARANETGRQDADGEPDGPYDPARHFAPDDALGIDVFGDRRAHDGLSDDPGRADADDLEDEADLSDQADLADLADATAMDADPAEALRRGPAPSRKAPPPPPPSNLIVREANIYDGILEDDIDRLVLDLPEPWRVLPHALDKLRPGGIVACYSPSILQVQKTYEALVETRAFTQIESLEVLYRPWQIKGQAVRPVQQMVSHTAFLTFARRLAARGRRPDDPAGAPDAQDTQDAAAEELLGGAADDEA